MANSKYEESVKQFSALSYENKKKKVVSMLKILKEEWNVFDDLYNLVNVIWNISEDFLMMVYKVITKAMYAIKEKEVEKAVEKLENIKDKISSMREKEAKEKENTEDILARI